MHQWWQLATRSWRANAGRSLAVVLAVSLGVTAVVCVTSIYENVNRAISGEVVNRWLGAAHVSVSPVGAHWGALEVSLADDLRALPNVRAVAARLTRRMIVLFPTGGSELFSDEGWIIDAIGIDPRYEYDFRSFPNLEGRLLEPGESGGALVERETALEWNRGLGDTVALATHRGAPTKEVKIVGLFDSQRVAAFQQPMVYVLRDDLANLRNEPGAGTEIDVMLSDASPAAVSAAEVAIRKLVTERGLTHRVESAGARIELLNEADRIARLAITLVTVIAMLFSFFIIFTTMSMGLFARQTQFGILRCIGLTRRRLAALLLVEVGPLCIAGGALGIALGSLIIKLVSRFHENGHVPLYVSGWGARLGLIGAVATAVAAWAALVQQVNGLTPLAAVRTDARPTRRWPALVVGVIGLALIATHEAMMCTDDATRWLKPWFGGIGSLILPLGYALAVPLVVVLLGPTLTGLCGALLRLPHRLVRDQVDRAPWRSTGVCWMLMAGVSMITYLGIRAEGVLAAWDFPARLPEAFIWSQDYVASERVDALRDAPGIGKWTITTDVDCAIEKPGTVSTSTPTGIFQSLLQRMTRPVFVAGEPDQLLSLLKITFEEGSLEDALAKMKRGGYVVIPLQTARTQKLHLGDHVAITVHGRRAEFEVAGVVSSPALDLAVTAFQATSYMDFAAAAAMLGTMDDLKQRFGLNIVSMVMFNFDLETTPAPDEFSEKDVPYYRDDRLLAEMVRRWLDRLPEERAWLPAALGDIDPWLRNPSMPTPPATREALLRLGKAIRAASFEWDDSTPVQRWLEFRRRLVMYRIADQLERPDAVIGSLTRLRGIMQSNLRRASAFGRWLPTIALAVAAVGVANLMMVSVHLRSRQLAMLRAVGASRFQIVRLILAEAIALALLGSAVGIALGMHQVLSVDRIIGAVLHVTLEFIIPYGTLAGGIGITLAACLIASIGPARLAARTNIVGALQVT